MTGNHSIQQRNPKLNKRKSYYSVLEKNNFIFDIREFKSKKVKCPNNNCQHSKKAFVTRVQAEVDVAITMTTMELLLSHSKNIKNIVFVIGDRDFYDLFKHLKKYEFNTYIFGFRKNLSGHYFSLFSPENIIYLNDNWDKIMINSGNDDFPPLTLTGNNYSDYRNINLNKTVNETPKHKPGFEKETSST